MRTATATAAGAAEFVSVPAERALELLGEEVGRTIYPLMPRTALLPTKRRRMASAALI
jgi:hypothetical protein